MSRDSINATFFSNAKLWGDTSTNTYPGNEAGLILSSFSVFHAILWFATFAIVVANPSEAGWPSVLHWINIGVLAFVTERKKTDAYSDLVGD